MSPPSQSLSRAPCSCCDFGSATFAARIPIILPAFLVQGSRTYRANRATGSYQARDLRYSDYIQLVISLHYLNRRYPRRYPYVGGGTTWAESGRILRLRLGSIQILVFSDEIEIACPVPGFAFSLRLRGITVYPGGLHTVCYFISNNSSEAYLSKVGTGL